MIVICLRQIINCQLSVMFSDVLTFFNFAHCLSFNDKGYLIQSSSIAPERTLKDFDQHP